MVDASAFQFLLMIVTGWLARREREVVAYLTKNRCLRRQLGTRRVRRTDDDRRRLAARATASAGVPYATSPPSPVVFLFSGDLPITLHAHRN